MINEIQPFLDNPQELTTQPIEIQLAVANNPATPRELLELLVASDNPEVATAAQNHVNWAGELTEDCHFEAEKLLRNSNLGQNDRLAVELLKFAPVPECFLSEWVPSDRLLAGVKNPYLPGRYRVKLLERLAREPLMLARLEAAEHPETPVRVLEELAGDVELPVRVAVRYNPNCPTETIALVEPQRALASNWETDPQQLAELAESRWSWVRLGVAQNPSTPPEVLEKLALDDFYLIQRLVARNPFSPTAALEKLMGIDVKSIRQALAEHPNASEPMLLELLLDCERIITNRANLPVSILERLAEDREWRYWSSRQQNTTEAILARLLQGAGKSLRLEIAANPQASGNILERLAGDTQLEVRLAVAQNPKTAIDLKTRLYQELAAAGEEDICRKIAADPNTPIFVLEQIGDRELYPNKLKDKLYQVLTRLLERPPAPAEISANDEDEEEEDDISALIEDRMEPCIERIRQILSQFQVAANIDEWMGVLESWGFFSNLWRFNEEIDEEGESLWEGEYEEKLYEEISQQRTKILPTLPSSTWEELVAQLWEILGIVTINAKYTRPVALALVGNPNTPAGLREQLQTKLTLPPNSDGVRDWDLRLALALNPAVPEAQRQEYLEEAIASENYEAISALVENPLTSTSTLEQLINRYGQLQQICRHPNAPLWFLEKMASEEDDNFYTIERVVSNPKTPPELIKQLFEKFVLHPTDWKNFVYQSDASHQSFLETFLRNPHIDKLTAYRVKQELKNRSDALKVREYMTSHRQKRLYLLMESLKNGDRDCRSQVARKYDLPDFIVEQLARDPVEEVRWAAVESRDLPLNLRLELTRDPSPQVRREIARQNPYYEDRLVPAEVLERLANDESQSVREVVAENPNTPPEVLAQLANDTSGEVKKKVVSNPNTPVEILERLGLSEGIFDKRNPKTPGSVLALAVERAKNEKALIELLEYSTLDSQMPAETLEKLASDSRSTVRCLVAKHRNTPARALEGLAEDDYWSTRLGVCKNRNTPARVLEWVFLRENPSGDGYNTICYTLSLRSSTPSSVLAELASHSDKRIRKSVAAHSNTSVATLERSLDTESDRDVLESLSRNPSLTPELQGQVLEKSSAEVLQSLSKNPSLTPELQRQLARHPNPKLRYQSIYNPNFLPELWQQLAEDESAVVRGAIARHADCPIALLETLARDEDKEVRSKAAANPKAPVRLLETLSRDSAPEVRAAVAENANAPLVLLEKLAQDEDVSVRRAVVCNSAIPRSLQEKWRYRLERSIELERSIGLRGVGRLYDPDTDDLPLLLLEYARTPVPFVRFVTLMHPLAPADALREASESVWWWERYAVAANPATPAEILERLMGDSDRVVRATAQLTINN